MQRSRAREAGMTSLAMTRTEILEMGGLAQDAPPMCSHPRTGGSDSVSSENGGDSNSGEVAPQIATTSTHTDKHHLEGEVTGRIASVLHTPPKSPLSAEREQPDRHGRGWNASVKSQTELQLHNQCEHPANPGSEEKASTTVGSASTASVQRSTKAPVEKKPHHLLKHVIAVENSGMEAVKELGASSVKEAVEIITRMPQRELQKKFGIIYSARSLSNNNNWLRRKLLEAICPKDDASPDALFVKEAMSGLTNTRASKAAGESGAHAMPKEPRRPRAAAAGVSIATAAVLREPALEYGAPSMRQHPSKGGVRTHYQMDLNDSNGRHMKYRQGTKRSWMEAEFGDDRGETEEEIRSGRVSTVPQFDAQMELARSLRQLAGVLSTALQATGHPGLPQTMPLPAHPRQFATGAAAPPGTYKVSQPSCPPPNLLYPAPALSYPFPPQEYRPSVMLPPPSYSAPMHIPKAATRPQAVKLNPGGDDDQRNILARLMSAAMEDHRVRAAATESQLQPQSEKQGSVQSNKEGEDPQVKIAIQRAEQGLDVLRQRARTIPGSNFPMPQLLKRLLPGSSEQS